MTRRDHRHHRHAQRWTLSPDAPLRPFYRNYEDWASRVGLVGNVFFFLGSLAFAFDLGPVSKVLFVLGSSGMLYRAMGRRYADRRIRREWEENHRGGEAMAHAREEIDTAAT